MCCEKMCGGHDCYVMDRCLVFHSLMDSVFLSSDTLKPIEINKTSKVSSTERVDALLAKIASHGLYPPSHSTYKVTNEHSFGILRVWCFGPRCFIPLVSCLVRTIAHKTILALNLIQQFT